MGSSLPTQVAHFRISTDLRKRFLGHSLSLFTLASLPCATQNRTFIRVYLVCHTLVEVFPASLVGGGSLCLHIYIPSLLYSPPTHPPLQPTIHRLTHPFTNTSTSPSLPNSPFSLPLPISLPFIYPPACPSPHSLPSIWVGPCPHRVKSSSRRLQNFFLCLRHLLKDAFPCQPFASHLVLQVSITSLANLRLLYPKPSCCPPGTDFPCLLGLTAPGSGILPLT